MQRAWTIFREWKQMKFGIVANRRESWLLFLLMLFIVL